RDGISTGRLLEPVIRPRGVFARISSAGIDGTRTREKLAQDLGSTPEALEAAVVKAERALPSLARPIVHFDNQPHGVQLSVRAAFRGKHILLIGVTGFIGKVWLVNTLLDLPDVGRIYLLIRRQKSNPARSRFERLIEQSPVFDPLYEKYGPELAQFLEDRIQVIEGDVTQPGLGLDASLAES